MSDCITEEAISASLKAFYKMPDMPGMSRDEMRTILEAAMAASYTQSGSVA